MFDTQKKFNIPNLDGSKRCEVRFPTDQEWCERARKLKTVARNLGRQKRTFDTPNAKRVDADLFSRIRIDADGATFSEAEAAKVIDRLDSALALEVQREGFQYRVVLKVPGATTTHVLKIPSQDSVDRYTDESGHTEYGPRSSEIRFVLDPAGPLYDSVLISVDGYASAVPINHKFAAVRAMLTDIETEAEADDPED